MPDAPRRRGAARTAPAPDTASPTSPGQGGDADVSASRAGPRARGPSPARALADGRVQMLVYLPPDLVRAVKHAALDRDTSASHVVEQALTDWLTRAAQILRRGGPASPTAEPAAPPGPAIQPAPGASRQRTRGKRP